MIVFVYGIMYYIMCLDSSGGFKYRMKFEFNNNILE